MNSWLKNQLQVQFDRAVRLGWLPYFVEAAKTHTTGYFDAADLMGIGSRETNFDPKWLTKAGDGGNGYGLLQADVRSFPEWIASGKWRDAREGILMGARVLMMKFKDVQYCIGKRNNVRSSKSGTVFTFIGKRVEGAELQKVTIASYNAGRWAHYAVSKGQNADKYTTGGDYSADVIARAEFFRPLIKKWMTDNGPTVQPSPSEKPVQTPEIEREKVLPATPSQTNDEPTAENENLPADYKTSLEELTNNVSTEKAKSVGSRVWQILIRPFVLLYAALAAGNVYAWVGIVVFTVAVGLMLYWHRADIKKLINKF